MSIYTIEYRAPRMKEWRALSVSARVPFPTAEINRYKQLIAETLTASRGEAVMADMIRCRTMIDGKPLVTEVGP